MKDTCYSCCDGCACGLPLGHDGPHVCAYAPCGSTWTDADEARFMDDLKQLS